MPSDSDQPDPDLLARIPLSARTVLEIGCGAGALGAAYRQLNPRARLLGTAADPASAAVAARRLDAVAVAAIDADPLPFDLPPGSVDCILYGEALGELADPWPVLRRHADTLSDAGTMLLRVPNPAHWAVADGLLRGTLGDAPPAGWFAPDQMAKRLEALGLVPYDVAPRGPSGDDAQRFLDALGPALVQLGIDPAAYARRSGPRQFLWRVRKYASTRLTVAATMLNPVGGVSDVRIVLPLQAMASDPAVLTRVVRSEDRNAPAGDAPRVFVLHRPVLAGPSGMATMRALLTEGWVVVTEFDDHPDFFKALLADPNQLSFRGVHAVQTSTPALAQILRSRNPEIAMFPNAVRALPEPRNFIALPALTLFFGALNREPDWPALMPALNAVAAEAGDRLRFQVVHDRGFFDALQSPYKQFTPTCDYETYQRILGGCEIGFMPLSDTDFNRAKSDLKFIETGACRVATLASPIVYGDTIVDGETGLLFRDATELHDRLRRLVFNPDMALTLAENARTYIERERMLAYQTEARIAWYRSLWARRHELTRALHARLAEPVASEPSPLASAGQEVRF
jgi:SAM-dependent methyltransferase